MLQCANICTKVTIRDLYLQTHAIPVNLCISLVLLICGTGTEIP